MAPAALEETMDYEKRLNGMLMEVCQDFTSERYAAFTKALALTLSEAFALIQDKDQMTHAMTAMFGCIAGAAAEQWTVLHDQTQQDDGVMTAEEFLRDVFNPPEKND
jgi:plasmid maintenance system antidote protein VapI